MSIIPNTRRQSIILSFAVTLTGCASYDILAIGGHDFVVEREGPNTFDVREVGFKASMSPITKQRLMDEKMPALIERVCGPAGGGFESTISGINYSALLMCNAASR